MSERFIEVYPIPEYMADGSFGWKPLFKEERMLIKTSDVQKAWIHMLGECNYVALDYFDCSKNCKKRAMFGQRGFDMSRANWSYAFASKDFEKLCLELNK